MSGHNHVGHTHTHPQQSGWHTWAYISAHLTLQLEDFSLMLLLQAMGSDLQVDQLFGDLWVAKVRGGACSTLLWALSFLPAPQGPTLTSSRCSSLSSTSEGSAVLMLVAQAGVPPGTPGSQSSISGRTWGGTTTHPPGGSQGLGSGHSHGATSHPPPHTQTS